MLFYRVISENLAAYLNRLEHEAGYRHTDLQAEFRARVASTAVEAPAIHALQEEKADAMKKMKALTADVTALTATVQHLERIIQMLALENHELRSSREGTDAVVPIRRQHATDCSGRSRAD